MPYRLLIVDDDRDLVKMLSGYFKLKQYEVLTAGDGLEALEKIKEEPDLVLLDINMPFMDGMEVLGRIREKISCPVLFLTARVEEEDRVNGLMAGGDDYILKPFSLKELEARVAAHLKREERHRDQKTWRMSGEVYLDYSARQVWILQQPLELTRTEYEIVEFLSMHPGQVFDRERIYERVRGYDAEGDSRVVTELIRRIRGKMQRITDREYIETVWGMGYRWKK
ncbi:MAG: response regulator transcription factor [Ruminococcus sp.]